MKRNPKQTFVQGDQHTIRVLVKDLSLDKNGKQPANVAAMSGKLAVSVRGKMGYFKDNVLVVTSDMTQGADGIVDSTITSTDSASLLGFYHWQLSLDDGVNGAIVVAEGEFEYTLKIDLS
jgi:hypothetical protein